MKQHCWVFSRGDTSVVVTGCQRTLRRRHVAPRCTLSKATGPMGCCSVHWMRSWQPRSELALLPPNLPASLRSATHVVVLKTAFGLSNLINVCLWLCGLLKIHLYSLSYLEYTHNSLLQCKDSNNKPSETRVSLWLIYYKNLAWCHPIGFIGYIPLSEKHRK